MTGPTITACGRTWEVHPAAARFPMMGDEELISLAADIRTKGLRDPILRQEQMILDGRNRLKGCELAGVAPVFRDWDGRGSAIALVVSLNLHRRHLDPSQRALIAAELLPEIELETQERLRRWAKRGSESDAGADAQLWVLRRPGAYGWHIYLGHTERIHETALVVEDVDSDADLRLVLKRWAGVRT